MVKAECMSSANIMPSAVRLQRIGKKSGETYRVSSVGVFGVWILAVLASSTCVDLIILQLKMRHNWTGYEAAICLNHPSYSRLKTVCMEAGRPRQAGRPAGRQATLRTGATSKCMIFNCSTQDLNSKRNSIECTVIELHAHKCHLPRNFL